MIELSELARYAQAAKARSIRIVGHRAASRLEDGSLLVERPPMAQERAKKIASIFEALGVAPEVLSVTWVNGAAPGTGRDDWRNRKVDITVTPGDASQPQVGAAAKVP
jgi:outer membrane protein OmpA-like peptidoglycan-associated protein